MKYGNTILSIHLIEIIIKHSKTRCKRKKFKIDQDRKRVLVLKRFLPFARNYI